MSISEISVADLRQELTGGARLIDVREPDEYAQARVPGAELIPLDQVADRLDAFRSDGTTYVICRSGGRSMRACEIAVANGIENVVNVEGGTMAWLLAGYDVDADDPDSTT